MWDYVCTVCGKATPTHKKCRWCGEEAPDRRCCNTCVYAQNTNYNKTERLKCEKKGEVMIDELCKNYVSVYKVLIENDIRA